MKKFSRIFGGLRSLPKRVAVGAIIAVAALIPVAQSAADSVLISGNMGVANVTSGDVSFSPSVSASPEQIVKLQMAYRNQESAESGKAATNLRIKVDIPSVDAALQTQTAVVSADNTNTVTGTATVNLSTPNAHLEYIPGSATWRHVVAGAVVDSVVSDAVTSANGVVLESQAAAASEASLTVLARVVAKTSPVVVEPVLPVQQATNTDTTQTSPLSSLVTDTSNTLSSNLTASATTLPGTVSGYPRCDVTVDGDRSKAFIVQNHIATVPFKVSGVKGCKVRLSVSSFYAPSIDGKPWSAQILYQRFIQEFTPGSYTMSVGIPVQGDKDKGCFYQVDLSYGKTNVLPVLAYGHGALDYCGPIPNVGITKTVSKSIVKVNEEFVYTVRVTNNGQLALTNVKVTDPAPTNVVFVRSDNGVIDLAGKNWSTTIASLAIGETREFNITAKVIQYVPSVLNTACVNAPEVDPTNPTKDDACASVPVTVQEPQPAVLIDKSVSKSQLRVGEEFVYTIKVTNTGDTPLTNVKVVDDPAPAGVKFLSADSGMVNADGTSWMTTVANLAVGASVEFHINAKVVSYVQGTLINTACVFAPEVNPSQPNSSDDCDNVPVTVTPDRPSITIAKSVSKSMLEVGEEFTYTVKVTNTGDVALQNAHVYDGAPTHTMFLSADKGQIINNGDFWSYVIPSLAVGESVEFHIQAQVTSYSADQIVNRACVNAPAVNPAEPNIPDDCATVPVGVITHTPNVNIVKTVSKDVVRVGEDFVYNVKVTNTGDVNLTNVRVVDVAPANVRFLSADLGAVNAAGNSWSYVIPALAIGESQTFNITAEVSSYVAGMIRNTACVYAPEVNPSNPSDSDGCSTVPVVVQEEHPSVMIDKVVSKNILKIGEEFTYTVRVTNNGDVSLANVLVGDLAPGNITFLSASEGSVTATKWSMAIPSLAVGESRVYAITAKVNSYVPGPVINTACVNAPEVNQTQPTIDDDCDEAAITVEKPLVPIYTCDLLTLTASANRTVVAGVNFTAGGGATFKAVTFNFGDNSSVATDSTIKSHQYAADGTYTVTARVLFSVNGADVYAKDSDKCMKQVAFTSPGQVLSAGPSRPALLPDTGASGVLSMAAFVALIAGVLHRVIYLRRKAS